MGRKLIAMVAAGVVAGATSAMVALAASSDHGVGAGDPQPSTLLQSASGTGDATLATAPASPASPVSGDAAAAAGDPGSVAPPGQSADALVVHGVATATPQPAAGAHISVGATPWPVLATPTSPPSASPVGLGHVSVPSLPALAAVPLSTPTATPTAAPRTPAPATASPVPSPTPAPRPPVCLLVICLRL
ncbi:MAG: hypothetical protein QOG45_1042 [Chloroflexota bacterium]|nr:hypothetical protein [Chloroflexota bacterium]